MGRSPAPCQGLAPALLSILSNKRTIYKELEGQGYWMANMGAVRFGPVGGLQGTRPECPSKVLKLARTLSKILMGSSPVSGPEAKFKGPGSHLSTSVPVSQQLPLHLSSPQKGLPLGLDLPPCPFQAPLPWASQKKGVKASPEAGAPTGRNRGGSH